MNGWKDTCLASPHPYTGCRCWPFQDPDRRIRLCRRGCRQTGKHGCLLQTCWVSMEHCIQSSGWSFSRNHRFPNNSLQKSAFVLLPRYIVHHKELSVPILSGYRLRHFFIISTRFVQYLEAELSRHLERQIEVLISEGVVPAHIHFRKCVT